MTPEGFREQTFVKVKAVFDDVYVTVVNFYCWLRVETFAKKLMTNTYMYVCVCIYMRDN